MAHVEIYRERRRRVGDEGEAAEWDEWRWRLKAGNGEIVASGESYRNAHDAERGFRDAAHAVTDVVGAALEEPGRWPELVAIAKEG
jgi:uncharacterized protein YegP (UPF0339 family)